MKLKRPSHTERIFNLHVSPGGSQKALAQHVWNQLVGAGQGVVKAEPLRDHAAVLGDILLVLPVSAAPVTGGFGGPVFRGPEGVILNWRGTCSLLGVKQASKVPLLQPRMRQAGFCCGSFPVAESTWERWAQEPTGDGFPSALHEHGWRQHTVDSHDCSCIR